MLLPNRTLTSVLLIYCLGLAATASAAQHAFQSYCSAKSLSEVALNASWIKEETEAYRVDAGQISNPFYKEALLLAARNYFLKKPSEFDLAIFFLRKESTVAYTRFTVVDDFLVVAVGIKYKRTVYYSESISRIQNQELLGARDVTEKEAKREVITADELKLITEKFDPLPPPPAIESVPTVIEKHLNNLEQMKTTLDTAVLEGALKVLLNMPREEAKAILIEAGVLVVGANDTLDVFAREITRSIVEEENPIKTVQVVAHLLRLHYFR